MDVVLVNDGSSSSEYCAKKLALKGYRVYSAFGGITGLDEDKSEKSKAIANKYCVSHSELWLNTLPALFSTDPNVRVQLFHGAVKGASYSEDDCPTNVCIPIQDWSEEEMNLFLKGFTNTLTGYKFNMIKLPNMVDTKLYPKGE
jgi:hypothetical protein